MVTMRVSLRSRKSGWLVTLSTIVGLVVVLGLTLFGTGAANNAVASFDVSSWLWSSNKGEVARVNGVTGKVDTRTRITDAQGHTMQVTQSDRFVILRDLNTGKVSVLDLSSLTLGASTQSTPGLGVTVAVHDDVAFIVDAVQGLVRQLDPATLLPVGETLSFPPGISGGTFDDSGRLWLLVPSEFTVHGESPKLEPCVAWSGRFYCADDSTGTVYVLDAQGKPLDPIKIQAGGKALEIEVRENRMFINAPGGPTARVVDEKHHVRTVDKYANDVVGGDAPSAPPPPTPTKPPVGPPGAPGRGTATAGNAQA